MRNRLFHMLKVFTLSIFLSTSAFGSNTDINLDKLSAKAINKHVVVFFHMTHCPYCERMLNKVFQNKEIKNMLNNYFIMADVNINTGGEIINKDFKDTKYKFAKKHNISFYPTILFIDNNNKIVHTLKGYRDKDKFLDVLNFVHSKSYIHMSFEDYIDELEFNKPF